MDEFAFLATSRVFSEHCRVTYRLQSVRRTLLCFSWIRASICHATEKGRLVRSEEARFRPRPSFGSTNARDHTHEILTHRANAFVRGIRWEVDECPTTTT